MTVSSRVLLRTHTDGLCIWGDTQRELLRSPDHRWQRSLEWQGSLRRPPLKPAIGYWQHRHFRYSVCWQHSEISRRRFALTSTPVCLEAQTSFLIGVQVLSKFHFCHTECALSSTPRISRIACDASYHQIAARASQKLFAARCSIAVLDTFPIEREMGVVLWRCLSWRSGMSEAGAEISGSAHQVLTSMRQIDRNWGRRLDQITQHKSCRAISAASRPIIYAWPC